MSSGILQLGAVHGVEQFRQHLNAHGFDIPCDLELLSGSDSPLARSCVGDHGTIANRIAMQPMEGWDGTTDGRPTANTLRRWRRFGQSGAKLIWGGEAVAVTPDARANPNQIIISPNTETFLAQMRQGLLEEHRNTTGSRWE